MTFEALFAFLISLETLNKLFIPGQINRGGCRKAQENRVGKKHQQAMKSLQLFSFVPILILIMSGFLYNSSGYEISAASNNDQKSCNANCEFGSCSTSCLDTQTPSCSCNSGVASCSCTSGIISSSGVTLSLSPIQESNLRDFENYLRTLSSTASFSSANDLAAIRSAILNQKVEDYIEAQQSFKNNMENLPAQEKTSTQMRLNSYNY